MSSETTQRWPLGMVVRPPADPAGETVETTDTVTGRRFRWSPDSLAGAILTGSALDNWLAAIGDDTDRQDLTPGWRHWYERGWHPSDQYYVASRRWQFADIDDADGLVRTEAIREYLRADGPPPAEVLPDGPHLPLGSPALPADHSLADLMVSRRSGRAYVRGPVPIAPLSGLLWFGLADVRARRERMDKKEPLSYLESFGTAWDFYLCVYAVTGIEPGTYRYDVQRHELIGIRPGDHRAEMVNILQGMRSPMTAAWTLGLVADFPRYQWRYRHEHGLRRLYLESGILGQELIILGAAYGLSALVTPAQRDEPYLELHGLSGPRYAPVYTLTMGPSRGARGIDFGEDFMVAAGEVR